MTKINQNLCRVLPVAMLSLLLISCGGGNDPVDGAAAPAPAAATETIAVAAVPAPELPPDAPLLAETYPVLSSGPLKFARLAELEPGYLLHTEGLLITQDDLAREIAALPPQFREEMQKNAFFIVEQRATHALLMNEARRQAEGSMPRGDDALLQAYLEKIVEDVAVDDEDIAQFYEDNRDMVGGAALEQVTPQIRQHLLQQKKQHMIEDYVMNLGRDREIGVAADWAAQQAAYALDNPIDQARASGMPTVASFGADTCRPCQMMKPTREAIQEEYAGKLNMVYVHVNIDQILATRYGVRGIPFTVFFDAEGNRIHEQAGLMTKEQILPWLEKSGVDI